MKIAIDSFYLVKMLADETMQDIAALIQDEKLEAIIAQISLVEVYSVLARRDKARAAKDVARLWTSKLRIEQLTPSIVTQAGDFKIDYKMHLADAIIAATAIAGGAKHVLTEDAHFKKAKNKIKPIELKALREMLKKEAGRTREAKIKTY